MRDPNLLVLQPGTWFHERYRVVRCLAAGGMGAVYEVVDTATDAPRALKVILPDLVGDFEARARFALEARITGTIQSDHLVRITDAGLDKATGMPFLVMDLLDGRDLGALVAQRGPLPPAEVVVYLSQAAMALDKTHAAGIIHRDLKPENLFVTRRDDGSPCVKILDFGIAKVVADSARAQQTRPMGTPLYMSPEQVMGTGAIGPRADIYSLGQIAYTLLSGEPYWMEEANGTLYALLGRVALGPDEAPGARARRRRGVALSPAFDAWFRRVTALDPASRFEQASQAAAALGEALSVGAPGAQVAAPPQIPALPAHGGTLRSAGVPSVSSAAGSVASVSSVATIPIERRRSSGRTAAILAAVLTAAGVVVAALLATRPVPGEKSPALVADREGRAAGSSAPAAVDRAASAGEAPEAPPSSGPQVSPGSTMGPRPGETASGPAPTTMPAATTARPGVRPRAPAATATSRASRPLKDEGIY